MEIINYASLDRKERTERPSAALTGHGRYFATGLRTGAARLSLHTTLPLHPRHSQSDSLAAPALSNRPLASPIANERSTSDKQGATKYTATLATSAAPNARPSVLQSGWSATPLNGGTLSNSRPLAAQSVSRNRTSPNASSWSFSSPLLQVQHRGRATRLATKFPAATETPRKATNEALQPPATEKTLVQGVQAKQTDDTIQKTRQSIFEKDGILSEKAAMDAKAASEPADKIKRTATLTRETMSVMLKDAAQSATGASALEFATQTSTGASALEFATQTSTDASVLEFATQTSTQLSAQRSAMQSTAAARGARSPLAYIGAFATALQAAVPGALAFITAAGIGGILVLGADWFASHTGPLGLQDGSTSELDTLASIMKAADKTHSGVDELGALALASGPVVKSAVTWQTYTVRPGDTITGISRRFGLENLSTIIAVNGVDNARAIQAGKKIRIPSMDGIVHKVAAGNSIASISSKYSVSVEDILDVNDLATKELAVGQELFIPGATMDNTALREAMGDLFKCPIRASYRLSSHFGWRSDPFTGVRSYHSGIDMACPLGTPIYAAMGGKVITAGWSNVFGNYVIVDHQNGYQSLYGHMSKRIARKGQVVNQGDRLGLVGSTGYSTGPHLHFTVYKRGNLTDPTVLLRR